MIAEEKILNARILIVDDQKSNVQLLTEMLHEAGYQHIESTLDPYAVCDLHRNNRYDLILLDLLMPGMDGFQVMERLKETETSGYVPILVITAQPEHKLRALAAGARDFVSKPFDLVELLARIRNMLEIQLLYKQLEYHSQVLEQTVQERTAELRASEARFRRLTELSSDWYWEQDGNGSFTKVYGPVMEMLGIPTQDLPGSIAGDGGHWDEPEYAALKANMAARRPFLDFVYSRTHTDGTRQHFMVSGEPIFDASGRFTGYRGIGKDVTDSMQRKHETR